MSEPEVSESESPPERGAGRPRKVFELVFAIALAISLALAVQSYAVKPYEIPSGSMQPTLEIGERVLVNRFSEWVGSDPAVGQIIVFHPPISAVPEEQDPAEPVPRCGDAGDLVDASGVCSEPVEIEAEKSFIKRIVAGPGDRIKVLGGVPIVNGTPLEGDWETVPCVGAPGCDFPHEVTIPPDHWFVMGDNRAGSDDSRFWGPVPRQWIIGRAFASYWPPNRVGGH